MTIFKKNINEINGLVLFLIIIFALYALLEILSYPAMHKMKVNAYEVKKIQCEYIGAVKDFNKELLTDLMANYDKEECSKPLA